MLSESYRREVGLSVPEFQIILEICLDREGYSDVADKMTEIAYKDFQGENFVEKYYRYLQEHFHLDQAGINKIKKRVFNYTLENSKDSLVPEVIKTEFIRNMLEKNLHGRFREFNLFVTPELMNFVIYSFSKYAGMYSKDKFEYMSGNIKPYIQNCFGYYFQAKFADISAYASQKSTIISTAEGEESIYDLDKSLSLEQHINKELIEFKRIVGNILCASELLYNHKGVVFYDLWTRVKDKLTQARYKDAKKCIKRELNYSAASRILLSEPCDREIGDNDTYRVGIFNAREKILMAFEANYNTQFTAKRFKDIYQLLKLINAKEADVNNKRFFKGKTNKKNTVPDKDKYLSLIYAFASIRLLLSFLESEHIDPLTVPSTIFRKREYLNKFNSFSEYLKLHDVVVDLNKKAEEVDIVLPTNDEISDYLYREQIISVGKLKLVDIKKVLEHEIEPDETSCALISKSDKNRLGEIKVDLAKQYKHYKKSLSFAIMLAKKIQVTYDIEIFSNEDFMSSDVKAYRWNAPDKRIAKSVNAPRITSIIEKYDSELFNRLSKDENTLYNTIRYCSLSKAITEVLFTVIVKLEEVTNRLDLIDVVSNYEHYINLPSAISSLNDISNFLKTKEITLCKPNFDNSADTLICTIYNQTIKKFEECFNIIKSIRDREYSILKVNGVQASSVYEKYKEKLVGIARNMLIIYDNIGINNPTFTKCLASCDRDEGGYILYNNCPITTIKYDNQYFLHSLGYWISPHIEGELCILEIKENDTFI